MLFAGVVLLGGIKSIVDASSNDVVCVVDSDFDVFVEIDKVLVTGISVYGLVVISSRVLSVLASRNAPGSMKYLVVSTSLIGVCVKNSDVASLLKSSVKLSATDISL